MTEHSNVPLGFVLLAYQAPNLEEHDYFLNVEVIRSGPSSIEGCCSRRLQDYLESYDPTGSNSSDYSNKPFKHTAYSWLGHAANHAIRGVHKARSGDGAPLSLSALPVFERPANWDRTSSAKAKCECYDPSFSFFTSVYDDEVGKKVFRARCIPSTATVGAGTQKAFQLTDRCSEHDEELSKIAYEIDLAWQNKDRAAKSSFALGEQREKEVNSDWAQGALLHEVKVYAEWTVEETRGPPIAVRPVPRSLIDGSSSSDQPIQQ